MGLVRLFYQLARLLNDIAKLSSGSPKRIGKRLVNKFIGRNIIRRFYFK